MSDQQRPPSDLRPDPARRTARIAGALYLVTFVSIPILFLYRPFRNHDGFLLGTGSTTGVLWGALSEIVVGLAGIGTAVVLYPVTRRVSRPAALGLVAARLLETGLIFVGVITVLTMLTLRQDAVGADPSALGVVGQALTAMYNRTFLLSQSLMPVACDLLLGYLMYRSGLVPRALAMIALVGAPLLLASDLAVYFGVFDQVSTVPGFAALPVAVFEFALGVYLLVHGFRPEAVLELDRLGPTGLVPADPSVLTTTTFPPLRTS